MADRPVVDLLAVAMVAVAVFCAGRLVLAVAFRRRTERAVDAVHVVMGVSMAGMLTGWLTGVWSDAWMAAFVGSTLWFGWGIGRRLTSGSTSLASAHHLPHLVASAAMLYMVVSMRWSGMGGAGMHGMTAMAPASPALPVLVAALLVGSALLAAGRSFLELPVPEPVEQPAAAIAGAGADGAGAGTHRRTGPLAYHSGAAPGPNPTGAAAPVDPATGASWRSRGGEGRELAPWGTPVCIVVMSVAMAYMFITVRP